jgi:AAA-like domain
MLPEVQDWWESLIELQTRIGAHAEALSTFDQYRKYLAAVSAEHRVDIRPRCTSDRLIKMLRTPAQPIETPSLVNPRIFETVEGAVPAGSPYYVARHEDNAGKAAIEGSVSTLLIKGPGQTGKTSLLHRLLQASSQQGAVIYRTAWRSVTASEIKDPAQFYTTQMRGLAKTFNLPPPANNQSHLSPEATFEQYLRDQILAEHNKRLIWAIDDADRLFDVDYREDFFGLLRALHNERAFDPQDPLQHLTIVLTYSTEAHLFIQDLNRSPFNVGVRVELSDFTRNQVTELNERYESPLNQDQLERAYSLLNGHPYLTRKLLYSVQVEKNDPEAMLNENPFASRIYLAHLEHLDRTVNGTSQAAQEVKAGLRAIIAGAGCTRQAEARILASGIARTSPSGGIEFRCALYRRYFSGALT